MKQNLSGDVHQHHEVTVDIPEKDIAKVLDKARDTAISVIGFYMVADVVRHFLKSATS